MAYLKNKLVLHELQRKYVDFARENKPLRKKHVRAKGYYQMHQIAS